MTEQRLQEIERWANALTIAVSEREDVRALIAEVRRLREQQGNSLAQRLIEQRDAAIAEARNTLHLMAAWGCRDVLAHEEETCALCRAEHALEEALAERDEARAALDGWVKWASTSRCIYCGQEFVHDPHDQESADEPKKAHILTCAKHPMAQAQASLTEARRVLREVDKRVIQCSMCYAMIGGYRPEPHTPDCAIAAVLAQEEK